MRGWALGVSVPRAASGTGPAPPPCRRGAGAEPPARLLGEDLLVELGRQLGDQVQGHERAQRPDRVQPQDARQGGAGHFVSDALPRHLEDTHGTRAVTSGSALGPWAAPARLRASFGTAVSLDARRRLRPRPSPGSSWLSLAPPAFPSTPEDSGVRSGTGVSGPAGASVAFGVTQPDRPSDMHTGQ